MTPQLPLATTLVVIWRHTTITLVLLADCCAQAPELATTAVANYLSSAGATKLFTANCCPRSP